MLGFLLCDGNPELSRVSPVLSNASPPAALHCSKRCKASSNRAKTNAFVDNDFAVWNIISALRIIMR
jgi:hypothetical protein